VNYLIRGIYTAVTGLITQEAKMDVITNNMSNVNTNGFKSDTLSVKKFDDVLIESYDRQKGEGAGKKVLGSLSMGSKIDETSSSFEQGVLQATDSNADFAIDGRGFFTVSRNTGTTTEKYYTRDGHFHANAAGDLVNASGDSVLDTNGNKINVGINKFTCDESGILTSLQGQPIKNLLKLEIICIKLLIQNNRVRLM
jgi:flagellar basal-body rod protein FlgG